MRTRTTLAALTTLLLAPALASCGISDIVESVTGETSPSEAAYDVELVDFGEPGEITPTGTTLAMGEPAWLDNVTTYYDEEEKEQTVEGKIGASLLEIRPLDASMFERFDNAEEFAGYTPYAMVMQFEWTYTVPEGERPGGVDLFPLKEDGSDAEYLTSGYLYGPTNECGLDLPEYDEETNTAVTCIVGLSQDLPITSAEFNGEDYQSFMATGDSEY